MSEAYGSCRLRIELVAHVPSEVDDDFTWEFSTKIQLS